MPAAEPQLARGDEAGNREIGGRAKNTRSQRTGIETLVGSYTGLLETTNDDAHDVSFHHRRHVPVQSYDWQLHRRVG